MGRPRSFAGCRLVGATMTTTHAAAMEVHLRIRDVGSLKQKRQRLKALSADVRKAFPVGFAETDHHDLWQRSTVGIAVVASDHGHLERLIHTIRRHLEARPEIEVLEIAIAYMEEFQ
jgi:uncharacterized protein YlxP (DUF503 family)